MQLLFETFNCSRNPLFDNNTNSERFVVSICLPCNPFFCLWNPLKPSNLCTVVNLFCKHNMLTATQLAFIVHATLTIDWTSDLRQQDRRILCAHFTKPVNCSDLELDIFALLTSTRVTLHGLDNPKWFKLAKCWVWNNSFLRTESPVQISNCIIQITLLLLLLVSGNCFLFTCTCAIVKFVTCRYQPSSTF